MAVTAMNLVAITYVTKWLSGAMGGAASKMTGKAKSAMKGGASKASSAVSGGAGGAMAGGFMGGGDQTAVNNRFGGGVVAASGVAGGGGGRDEGRNSQTIDNSAPELEQSSLDQYGAAGLADTQSDRETYTEPSTESTESEERSGGDVEGRLDRLESEVGAEGEPSSGNSSLETEEFDGVLSDEKYLELADGNEEQAKYMKSRDEYLHEHVNTDGITEKLGKEGVKGTLSSAGSTVGGMVLGAPGALVGGIGGSVLGGAAERVIEAKDGTIRSGWNRTKSTAASVPGAVTSKGANMYSSAKEKVSMVGDQLGIDDSGDGESGSADKADNHELFEKEVE
ncbi:hypothetical protein [Halorhabdus salina]|uniref:hypothetical protein n=1 Tax=Halorhabdus salina TaxID=2750670 RepID=UPI0015EE4FC2|nr:hypothetical protein [Halorhabdus salina]